MSGLMRLEQVQSPVVSVFDNLQESEVSMKLESYFQDIERVQNVLEVVDSPFTSKTEIALAEYQLSTLQSSYYMPLRMENNVSEKETVKYRAEGILGSIWEKIVALWNWIVKKVKSLFGIGDAKSKVEEISDTKDEIIFSFNEIKKEIPDPVEREAAILNTASKAFKTDSGLESIKEQKKTITKAKSQVQTTEISSPAVNKGETKTKEKTKPVETVVVNVVDSFCRLEKLIEFSEYTYISTKIEELSENYQKLKDISDRIFLGFGEVLSDKVKTNYLEKFKISEFSISSNGSLNGALSEKVSDSASTFLLGGNRAISFDQTNKEVKITFSDFGEYFLGNKTKVESNQIPMIATRIEQLAENIKNFQVSFNKEILSKVTKFESSIKNTKKEKELQKSLAQSLKFINSFSKVLSISNQVLNDALESQKRINALLEKVKKSKKV